MNALFVFDGLLDLFALKSIAGAERTDMFALTSDYGLIRKADDILRQKGTKFINVIDSSDFIDREVSYLSGKLCRWSSELGESGAYGKKIKEWLLLPGLKISTWWLSLLSEKNALKTDIFFKIAQVRAIEGLSKKEKYDIFIISIADKKFRKSVIKTLFGSGGRIVFVGSAKQNARSMIISLLDRMKLSEVIRGFIVWLRFLKRRNEIRSRLGNYKKRINNNSSFLFVTYFPALDEKSAGEGIFKNKYAAALQKKLRDMERPVTWLFIYVHMGGINFKDSICLSKDFLKSGERLFYLEELLSVSDSVKGLFLWFYQIILSNFLYGFVRKKCTIDPIPKSCEPMVKSLWEKSFSGSVGIEGILYALIFDRFFKEMSGLKDCLYFSEMHAWEKSLNAAATRSCPNLRTIGYQHTWLSKRYFNYFYDADELSRRGGDTALPLPNILACNGEYSFKLLAGAGYKNLRIVEAIRYLHIKDISLALNQNRSSHPMVLLIVGSINESDSISLINIAYASFAETADDSIEIWFKSHPAISADLLFEKAGVDRSNFKCEIKHGNISEYLSLSRAVLVSSSAVSIEALAYGCEVIVPICADSMPMNPLVDFEGYYHKVKSPEELKAVTNRIARGEKLQSIERYRNIVKRYWLLDDKLPKWEELLNKEDVSHDRQ